MKKTGALAILATIIGTPSASYVAKYAWDRIESNTNAISKIREERAGDKSSIKAIHEDVKIIKTLLLQRRR
jgi:hypothetical protein